jgi:hypothetical protein
MNIDINNIFRSATIAVVGLPLALSTSGLINSAASAARNAQGVPEVVQVRQEFAGKIAKACYGYALSKNDSTLERESKTAIDEVFGGEVNYQAVCNALVF